MKRCVQLILAIIFLLCSLAELEAQNNRKMKSNTGDSIAIKDALEKYYFDGIYQGNLDLLSKIYNAGTLLFGDVKGQPYSKTLDEYLEGVKTRQSPKDSGKPFKGEIISIKLINSIAIAEVTVKMYDFDYHEFLSLHKFDDKWLIVNKMISDVNGQN